jgi:hypothetical protein
MISFDGNPLLYLRGAGRPANSAQEAKNLVILRPRFFLHQWGGRARMNQGAHTP